MTKRIIKDNRAKKSKGEQGPVGPDESVRQQASQAQAPQNSGQASKPAKRQGNLPAIIEGRLPLWKIALRLGGFILVVVLNIALIMSDVSHHHGARPYSRHANEFLLYAVLLCFNLMILIPALFEVRWFKSGPEGVQLATLWWKAKLTWGELIKFRHPRYLKMAMLRTKRCFYILNRRDLTNYDLIEAVLAEKVK
ncbi:MAG: hypothetical protein C5B53_11975 [Candidatus Melainabacteria bacterium]|nr:MAG: hypothetical protein C5B53_11975 [Candidatus Melainabacteria bacterium]